MDLSELCNGLKVISEDWERRVQLLARIPQLAQETIENGQKPREEVFRLLREPLAVQLSDRRSAVARQACDTITNLAAHYGSAMDTLAQALVPCLCKLVVVTIQIIAESGNSCILSILQKCPSSKLVPILAEAARDKHREMRVCAADYFFKILDTWPAPLIDRAWDTAGPALKALVDDADHRTRGTARRAYALLAQKLPSRADAILKSVSASTADKLQLAAAGGGSPSSPSGEAMSEGFRAASRAGSQRAKPATPLGGAEAGSAAAGAESGHVGSRPNSFTNASRPNPFAAPPRAVTPSRSEERPASSAAPGPQRIPSVAKLKAPAALPGASDASATGSVAPSSARGTAGEVAGPRRDASPGLHRVPSASRLAKSPGPGPMRTPSNSNLVGTGTAAAAAAAAAANGGTGPGGRGSNGTPQLTPGRQGVPGRTPAAASDRAKQPPPEQPQPSTSSASRPGPAPQKSTPRVPSASAAKPKPKTALHPSPSTPHIKAPEAKTPGRSASSIQPPSSNFFAELTPLSAVNMRVPTYAPFLYTPLGPKDLDDLDLSRAHMRRTLTSLREILLDEEAGDTAGAARVLLLTSDIARHAQPALWEESAGEVLELLRPFLQHADVSVREYAALVVRDLCSSQPAATWALGDRALAELFTRQGDASHEVGALTDEALQALIQHACATGADSEAIDRILSLCDRFLGEAQAQQALAPSPALPHPVAGSLRCLERLLRLASAPALSARLERMVAVLARALQSSHAEIRKAAVLCLALISHSVGEAVAPFLASSFNEAQRKLISIYAKRAGETGGAVSAGSQLISSRSQFAAAAAAGGAAVPTAKDAATSSAVKARALPTTSAGSATGAMAGLAI